MEALSAEAATISYSATGDVFQYIYSVLMTKNHQNFQSRCLVYEFAFTSIFLTILIMVTEELIKEKLWLLPFFMAVATYCYYEKVRRTMRTTIVSYLLKEF